MKPRKTNNIILLNISIIGIFCFITIIVFATTLYPGGSQATAESVGFDWKHNYLCNLFNIENVNGRINHSRPYAILAMVILCFSLMIFFIQFSMHFAKDKIWKLAIKYGGILSMTAAMLIFTSYHDLMTSISSFIGLFVVFGIIKEIYSANMPIFKTTGIICIVLLAANNYIYYSNHFIEALPLLQKTTFIVILSWIVGLSFSIKQKIRLSSQDN